MKLLFIFFIITISLSLNAPNNPAQPQVEPKYQNTETHKNPNYTYTIIPAQNKTWGYDIYVGKRLLIHQPGAPGLPGNEGFKAKANAEKVAKLVIEKLKKGEMPPTVTIDEMKKLKVL
jgi:hypothetical protein